MGNLLPICPVMPFPVHSPDGFIVENTPKFSSYCKTQQTRFNVSQTVLKNGKFDPRSVKPVKAFLSLLQFTGIIPKSSFGLPLLIGGRASVASWRACLSCCQSSNTPQHPVRSSLTCTGLWLLMIF